MDLVVGYALILIWGAIIVWSLARIASFAWRDRKDQKSDARNFGSGLLVGVALAGGALLFFEPLAAVLGIYGVGLGFLLALAAASMLLLFARDVHRIGSG
jgi:hypothetical protein